MQNKEIQIIDDTKKISFGHYNRLTEDSLDAYLAMLCLERTFGEVALLRDRAYGSLKVTWASNLLIDAVIEKDIALIEEISKRIDGAIPEASERSKFANIFGNALEDVMSYSMSELMIVHPSDPMVIALAKTMVWISVDQPKGNPQKRRDKARAVSQILSRMGGKKTKPEQVMVKARFVDPDWMKGLPDGSPEIREDVSDVQEVQAGEEDKLRLEEDGLEG